MSETKCCDICETVTEPRSFAHLTLCAACYARSEKFGYQPAVTLHVASLLRALLDEIRSYREYGR